MGLNSWLPIIFAAVTGVQSWLNNYGEGFLFQCPPGQHLWHIKTSYSREHEDTLFDFQCAASPSKRPPTICVWQSQFNHLRTTMDFRCGTARYFVGIRSEYKRDAKDRLFAFYCCNIPFNGGKYSTSICSRGKFPDDQDYVVPAGYMMTLVDSRYETNPARRTFSYRACKVMYAG